MRCYLVTDSELNSLALANGLSTACVSIMAFFIALAIDISREMAFAEKVTDMTKVFSDVIFDQDVSWSHYSFLVAAIAAHWWKR